MRRESPLQALRNRVTNRHIGVVTAIALAGIATAHEVNQESTINALRNQNEAAIEAGRKATENVDKLKSDIDARAFAETQAAAYSEGLNQGTSIPMPVLNGGLAHKSNAISDPADREYLDIVNPILLSPVLPGETSGSDGKFLEGSWLGIQANDAEGGIVIVPVLYEAQTYDFIPFSTEETVVPNANVYMYMDVNTDDDQTPSAELYAYNPITNMILRNPDDSFVTPGLSQGLK